MIDQPHWYGPGPHRTCSKCGFCDQCGPQVKPALAGDKLATPCARHPKKGSDQK